MGRAAALDARGRSVLRVARRHPARLATAAPLHVAAPCAPARRLHELFDALHGLTNPAAVVREAALREVHFLRPEDYAFDPLAMKRAD